MIEWLTLQHYSPPRYVETGWWIGYRIDGVLHSRLVGNGEEMMAKIEDITRSQQLSGFTLFVNPGKGWQMSVRRHNESAWSITHIPDEQAQAILSMLEASGHPDGPMQVKSNGATPLLTAVEAAERARASLTATIRARVA